MSSIHSVGISLAAGNVLYVVVSLGLIAFFDATLSLDLAVGSTGILFQLSYVWKLAGVMLGLVDIALALSSLYQ